MITEQDLMGYEEVILSVARKFSGRGLMEFEDLVSEGWILLDRIKEHYDGSRGSFTIFLAAALRNQFRTLYRSRSHRNLANLDSEITPLLKAINRFPLEEIYVEVGPDARMILDLVKNPPIRILHQIRRRFLVRSIQYRFEEILYAFGWSENRINHALAELGEYV